MASHSETPSATSEVGVDDQLNPAVLRELEELGGVDDPQFVTGILNAFLTEAPKQLQAIETTLGGGQPEALAKAAHALKGSARGIGATRLVELTYALEQKGRTGIMTGGKLLLAQIKAALDAVAVTVKNEIARRQAAGAT